MILEPFSGLKNLPFDSFSVKWLQISLGWLSKNRYNNYYYTQVNERWRYVGFKNIQFKRNLMPSAFSQPIYPNRPSNVTDILSTGENKGFTSAFVKAIWKTVS